MIFKIVSLHKDSSVIIDGLIFKRITNKEFTDPISLEKSRDGIVLNCSDKSMVKEHIFDRKLLLKHFKKYTPTKPCCPLCREPVQREGSLASLLKKADRDELDAIINESKKTFVTETIKVNLKELEASFFAKSTSGIQAMKLSLNSKKGSYSINLHEAVTTLFQDYSFYMFNRTVFYATQDVTKGFEDIFSDNENRTIKAEYATRGIIEHFRESNFIDILMQSLQREVTDKLIAELRKQ